MTACKTDRCGQGHKPCPTRQACGMNQSNSDDSCAGIEEPLSSWETIYIAFVYGCAAVGAIALCVVAGFCVAVFSR